MENVYIMNHPLIQHNCSLHNIRSLLHRTLFTPPFVSGIFHFYPVSPFGFFMLPLYLCKVCCF